MTVAPSVDDDVHGQAPGPRYGEFASAKVPGRVYVAYRDAGVTNQLLDGNALYRDDLGRLTQSAHYEFKLVERRHWIYGRVPYTPNGRRTTVVLWYRRPRRYSRFNDSKEFPWQPTTSSTTTAPANTLVLFTQSGVLPALVVRVTAFNQQRGRSATGYVVGDIDTVFASPDVLADLERASLQSAVTIALASAF